MQYIHEMTSSSTRKTTASPARRTLQELVRRADAAGIECSFVPFEGEDYEEDDPGYVKLAMPNGRKTRSVLSTAQKAKRLLSVGFEHYVYLGDYEALVDTRDGSIEALINIVGVGRAFGQDSGLCRASRFSTSKPTRWMRRWMTPKQFLRLPDGPRSGDLG